MPAAAWLWLGLAAWLAVVVLTEALALRRHAQHEQWGTWVLCPDCLATWRRRGQRRPRLQPDERAALDALVAEIEARPRRRWHERGE